MNNKIKKTAAVYTAVIAVCAAITNIYALFGHGKRSDYMDLMFVCPLICGLIFCVICRIEKGFSRRGANLFHSGTAAITAGLMLKGIMEIAGTDSAFIKYFWLSGAALIIIGIILVKTN